MARIAKRANPIEPESTSPIPPVEPNPELNTTTTTTAAAAAVTIESEPYPEPQPDESSPFGDMLKREYENAMQKEIKKGIQQISERFRRMLSQERRSTDVARDALGKSSDDYERIIRNYYSGNSEALAGTTEDLYEMLYELKFTEMKPLDVIKQQYQITK